MTNKIMLHCRLLLLFTLISLSAKAQTNADKVCGKWESVDKDIIVEVCKSDGNFKAKICWFDAGSDKLMRDWQDINNPDEDLKKRKLLGMNVLEGLVYKPESNSWEDGMIYDAKHGRYWNASAYIDKEGLLKVKGYWHFKFIGKTMTFNRL